MAELFQGLFIIFLIIDLGRFLVLNFVIDEWKNLRAIKWIITIILSLLFVYSAIGVYNKLNSMIPETVQIAMVEAASYNRAQDNAEIKQDRSSNLAEVAQSEYQKSMDWNAKDYENCIKRAKGDVNAENKCNNTKRRLDRNIDLDRTQEAINNNVKNQGEITGVLTTVCRILPNTDCKTYEGLQTALTIIILLVICGLDYLQLSIVLAVNTRKNKKEIKEEAEKSVEVEKIIEIPKEIIKKVKKPRKKKEKVVKEKPVIKEIISESVQTKPEVEQNASLKNSKKSTTSFTQKTGFYK